MPAVQFTTLDFEEMAAHWLGCQEGAYWGTGYGNRLRTLLQKPMADALADEQLSKLRRDVPPLAAKGVGLAVQDTYPDHKRFLIELDGKLLAVVGGDDALAESAA